MKKLDRCPFPPLASCGPFGVGGVEDVCPGGVRQKGGVGVMQDAVRGSPGGFSGWAVPEEGLVRLVWVTADGARGVVRIIVSPGVAEGQVAVEDAQEQVIPLQVGKADVGSF